MYKTTSFRPVLGLSLFELNENLYRKCESLFSIFHLHHLSHHCVSPNERYARIRNQNNSPINRLWHVQWVYIGFVFYYFSLPRSSNLTPTVSERNTPRSTNWWISASLNYWQSLVLAHFLFDWLEIWIEFFFFSFQFWTRNLISIDFSW